MNTFRLECLEQIVFLYYNITSLDSYDKDKQIPLRFEHISYVYIYDSFTETLIYFCSFLNGIRTHPCYCDIMATQHAPYPAP